jgi:GNAT superfamily N-acetyltransferase
MDWTIRCASLHQVSALEELITLSVHSLQSVHYSADQMNAALGPVFGVDRQLINDGTYFVAQQDGQIVGCGGWSKRKSLFGGDANHTFNDETFLDASRDAARVRAFFVHPSHARRGIGRAILIACENAIVDNGFSVAELVATLTGEALYLSCGYSEVERYCLPLTGGLRLPVVRMRKQLT